jgi:hypothetical protein
MSLVHPKRDRAAARKELFVVFRKA